MHVAPVLYLAALGFALFAIVTSLVWRFNTHEGGFVAFICAVVTFTFLALCLLLALLGYAIG